MKQDNELYAFHDEDMKQMKNGCQDDEDVDEGVETEQEVGKLENVVVHCVEGVG